MKKIKFGCHNFLNSKPILAPLIEKEIPGLEIVQDSPANLGILLKEGQLDISFVPSIEYARNSNYRLVNDISISSLEKVDTVLLISNTKMEDIKTVATDSRSLSSIVLLKILFMEKFQRLPKFTVTEPDCNEMLLSHDAALIIGDKSFSVDKKDKVIYDLSSEWFQITKKPFVHALLCVRGGVKIDPDTIKTILSSRDKGLSSLEQICEEAAKESGISFDKCLDYLRNKIIYSLGFAEQEGLKEFFILAHKHGFINSAPELKFIC